MRAVIYLIGDNLQDTQTYHYYLRTVKKLSWCPERFRSEDTLYYNTVMKYQLNSKSPRKPKIRLCCRRV